MRTARFALGLLLLAGIGVVYGQQQQSGSQETAKESPAPAPKEAEPGGGGGGGVNPVKPTPEGLASAKRMYGYDCAMCHGKDGDGKGDLAASMSLKLNDWKAGEGFAGLSDKEIFDIIVKGKGKMTGEGDRLKPAEAWNLVSYVKSLSKK